MQAFVAQPIIFVGVRRRHAACACPATTYYAQRGSHWSTTGIPASRLHSPQRAAAGYQPSGSTGGAAYSLAPSQRIFRSSVGRLREPAAPLPERSSECQVRSSSGYPLQYPPPKKNQKGTRPCLLAHLGTLRSCSLPRRRDPATVVLGAGPIGFLHFDVTPGRLGGGRGIWDVVGSLHSRLRERERRGQGQAFVVHCGVRPQDRGEASLAVSRVAVAQRAAASRNQA